MPAWTGTVLRRRRGDRRALLLLAVLLLAAAALRWNGLDWDQGHVFHPDERFILMVTAGLALPFPPDWAALLSPSSPLNPRSFAYGSLPFYLLKLVSHLLASLGELTPLLGALRPFADFDHLRTTGRFLSGLFDLGSLVLIYLIGCRLRDRWVGLLATTFLGFTVINVQYAHFYASDTLVTFFILAAMLFSVETLQTGRLRPAVFAGIAAGLAIGSKFSAMPVLAVLVMAQALRLFVVEVRQGAVAADDPEVVASAIVRAGGDGGRPRLRLRVPAAAELDKALVSLSLSFLSAAVVFLIVEPYAVIDFATFTKNLSEQNDMARGVADLPYTRQYANTPAYWYFIQNLLLWGMGLPLGLVALAGALGVVVKGLLRPRKVELLLLTWVLPYFAITGSFHAKFLRYLIPLTPFLCLLAAYGLLTLRDFRPARRRAIDAIIAIGVGGGILYALAFSNIYTDKHTAVRASEWIYQNVPKGSALLTEHWEEGLPVPRTIGGTLYDAGRLGYKRLTFEGYQPDDQGKFAHILRSLDEADYIVFFSNRLYDTIPRLPERYPITAKYYQLLFGEQLGFRLEAFFTAYPSILGVTLVEDTFSDPPLPVPEKLRAFQPTPLTIVAGKADESFSVYDHPKVLIFKKERRLSEAELRSLFGTALAQQPREPGAPVAGPGSKTLLLSEAQRAVVTAGGTFRDLFDRAGLENRLPVPVWVALVVLLGLLGLPLAFAVFHNLPDRGYLLARPLAILVLVWLDWMLVSLGWLPNTRLTALLALLLLALIGAYFARRQWPALGAFWRARRRAVLIWEAIFWSAFALFLLIRLANPDLWHPARGGEKPMDLAYLMAAIKSPLFPPYDPWFAGGYLNYYYYGQIVVATLIKLSGILPTTAYNLVVPLLFALTAGGAFSAVYNLAARRNGEDHGSTVGAEGRHGCFEVGNGGQEAAGAAVSVRPGEGSGREASPRATARRSGDGERAAMAAGIGGAAVAVLFGNLGGAIQLLEQLMRLGPPPLRSGLPGVEGTVAVLAGLWRLLVEQQPLAIPTDWYWASTRVLDGTINEFPFFTFLYADLHAHMIALPFTLLALGLAIAAVKGYGRRRAMVAGGAHLAGEGIPVASGRAAGFPTAPSLPSRTRSERAVTGEAEPADKSQLEASDAAEALASARFRLSEARAALTPELCLQALVTALVIGALMPMNSWDFPTYLALYGLAILMGWYLDRPLRMKGLAIVALKAAGVLMLGYALYWPFHAGFQQWYTGVEQIKDKSDIWGYLRIHGFFLFAIVSFLATETWRRYGGTTLLRMARLWLRHWEQLPRVLALQGRLAKRPSDGCLLVLYAIAAVLAAMLLLHLMGMTLVALLLGLLVWTAVLVLDVGSRGQATGDRAEDIKSGVGAGVPGHPRGEDGRRTRTRVTLRDLAEGAIERRFVLLLIGTGLALSMLVELVAIKGDVGRMNTVFKFYLQVWILWSVAAPLALYYAGRQLRAGRSWRPRYLWGAALAVLVAMSLVYPLIASRARVSDRYDTRVPMTLDGTAYMTTATFREQNPETKQERVIRLGTDLPAMRWLQDNVTGTPVILEGWAPLYHWGARYSIYTGLPTVIGWDWHQKQQRWGYQVEIDRRVAEVRAIYNDTSPERALALLAKYNVQYVIVGDLERAVYNSTGLAKFDKMVGQSLELVYDDQGVRIYRRL